MARCHIQRGYGQSGRHGIVEELRPWTIEKSKIAPIVLFGGQNSSIEVFLGTLDAPFEQTVPKFHSP